MKPKVLPLLERCVENGIERGYNKAHKHDDAPSKEQINACIYVAIMDEFDEWFEFDFPTIKDKE
jgi:hypothetical protein